MFSEQVIRTLQGLPSEDLERLRETVEAAVARGDESVPIESERVPASPQTLAAIRAVETARRERNVAGAAPDELTPTAAPIVVTSVDNYDGAACLGHLLRLYGSSIGAVRRGRGFEARTGSESLDFDRLREDTRKAAATARGSSRPTPRS